MWGKLFCFFSPPRKPNGSGCFHACLCLCPSVYRVWEEGKLREKEDDKEMHTWVRTTVFKVATNTPNLTRREVIKSHFHQADNSWTPTGKSTVRGACQLANSHHRRNYIHKHSLLFPQSAILTCCLPWLRNICCRSFHFYISPRSHNQIAAGTPLLLIFPKQRCIIHHQQRPIQH